MPESSVLASVTVTYHPDAQLLHTQLAALPPAVRKILVDNGSPDALWAELTPRLADIANLEILRLGGNLGLAGAINIGADHVRRTGGTRWLLLLDQDSVPQPNAVDRLVQAFITLSANGVRVGAVGPALLDPAAGRRHGFHIIEGFRWRRIDVVRGPPLRCDSLNGSGTVVEAEVFERLGGLDASFFIDHVDTEWSFRLMADGWQIFGVPEAEFVHRMGDSGMRLWLGGWRVWPIRSPLRHRYLFRNAIVLWRRSYVPLVWKIWVIPKLLMTAAVFAVVGPQRGAQLKAMALGLVDGLRERFGRI